MLVLKKDLKFSFTDWFKYNQSEKIIRETFHWLKDERVVTHNTLCLMKHDFKNIIHEFNYKKV